MQKMWKKDSILVFGTESSGLTYKKSLLLDEMIKIPMEKKCPFLTLTIAVPIVAYEFYRQMMENSKCHLKKKEILKTRHPAQSQR